ncbi:hypothetical protein EBH_0028910 [Eimeria brunetti]|uniref:Uncharacterized protein n=1 Tax=Eimeria brunetti TaxID=51314 RepID=U6LCW4_9EIME|nr:hypothetical protein EBH_0028910 [Eimeria brunetti]
MPGNDEGLLLLRVHPNVSDTAALDSSAVSAFGYKSFLQEEAAAAAAAAAEEEEAAAAAAAAAEAAAAEEQEEAAAAAAAAADNGDLTTEEFDRIQQMLEQTRLQEDEN